jgi:hypothetical protein
MKKYVFSVATVVVLLTTGCQLSSPHTIRSDAGVVEVIGLPDSCPEGDRECVARFKSSFKAGGGGIDTVVFHKDMLPSENCGGAPCPWKPLIATNGNDRLTEVLDFAQAPVAAVVYGVAGYNIAREQGRRSDNYTSYEYNEGVTVLMDSRNNFSVVDQKCSDCF